MTEQKAKSKKPSKKARITAARMTAVQCLYQMALSGLDDKSTYQDYVERRMGKEVEGDTYIPAELSLLSKILSGVSDKRQQLNDMVTGAMNSKSPEPLLQSILFCGLYELLAHHEAETAVIINDYVNIAHGFFEKKEAGLVNAILDRQAKNLR